MDTITELKPLFMRFFQEVDALNEKIKAQDEEIRKLRAENEIYAKVIRSEVQDSPTPTPTPINEVVEEEGEETPPEQGQDLKHVEIKRGRKRKYNTEEERKEKRKEYNRNYRQKQKAQQS